MHVRAFELSLLAEIPRDAGCGDAAGIFVSICPLAR
jgi:hypothetical protein